MIGLRRQHCHLARLDDHLLDDIGISRTAALAETKRPIWDAPYHWRRQEHTSKARKRNIRAGNS